MLQLLISQSAWSATLHRKSHEEQKKKQEAKESADK